MGLTRNKIKPTLIFGFGRSGTSWVSDIISRYFGKLILFEPCHPLIFSSSAEYCYHNLKSDTQADILQHLSACLNKKNLSRWLIRNYLSSPLDHSSEEFVKLVWENSEIIGFKEIRLNHSILELVTLFNANAIVIIRHPLAVIASITRRDNFWNEFGWENHWKMFTRQMEEIPYFTKSEYKEFQNLILLQSSKIEKIAYMWGLSHIVILRQLGKMGINPFYYEDLYLNPYATAREMISYLAVSTEEIYLHPSYLFTPSMTTHRTVHDLEKARELYFEHFPDFFWKGAFQKEQLNAILNMLKSIAQISPELSPLLKKYNI